MRRPSPGQTSRFIARCVFLSPVLFVLLTLSTAQAQNPIVIENQQPGSSAWDIGTDHLGTDGVGQIKGYASAVSVNKGQNITFYVSVNPAQTYTIDVYRIGWYQGLGGRLMQHIGPLNGTTQPICPMDPATGMIACNWAPAYTLATQTSWTSGVYLCVLTNAQGYQNLMIFDVRDDSRVAAILYQSPVTTNQAYNDWPDDGKTGKSLYDFNSYGSVMACTGYHSACKVSFDRPYQDSGIDEGFRSDYGEVNFIRWMEASGYDVTYATDVDTHANPGMLLNYKGVLSMGHDEYFSKPMYDGFNAARDAGVNLAFFGADAVSWQIRLENSSSGVPYRVEVCYRDVNLDPITDLTLKTITWLDPVLNRPQQVLIGLMYNDNSSPPQNSKGFFPSYVVTNSANWVYAGTGLTNGTAVTGLIGYEADIFESTFPSPVAVSGTYVLLSHSPWGTGSFQYSNSSVYQAPSGAWVFATGTMNWNWALDSYGHGYNLVDPRIQQTTANVLNRFVASPGAQTLPTVTGVTPASGPAAGGTAITIGGTNFAAGATVTLGGALATGVTVMNSTTITATTPGGAAGAVNVTVTNPDGHSATLTNGFTYTLPPPAVSSVTPASGTTIGGTAITISGSNFVAGATVTVGTNAAAGVAVVNSTTITATTPAGTAGTVSVTVTNPDGQSSTLANAFTYSATAPTISSVSPNTGPATGGTGVTITGTNFAAGATVTFGGNAATGVTVVNSTTITCTTPAHAGGAVNVTVTNADSQSATLASGFVYQLPPPSVSGVSPNSGSTTGGTAIIITGTNFAAGATVTLGGTAATGVTVVNSTTITATTPAHAVGAVNVTVTNTDGQNATLTSGFTYVLPPPTVSSVSPNSGSTTGGTTVTISGANFVAGASVSIGGTPATGVTVVNATTITATTPANAAGAVNVTVTNPDGQSGTLVSGFTYKLPPPAVSGVSPNSGLTIGGAGITMTGANFVTGATVTLGGTAATGVTVVNSTTITATTPAHAAGTVSVTVTNPDGQSGTLASGFTYTTPPAPTLTSISPNTGGRGTIVSVSLTGTALTGTTSVSVSGSGISVSNVTVVNDTTVTATFSITSGAGLTSRNVKVTTASGTSNALTFTVVLPPAPTLTSVSPNSGSRGTAVAVTLTGTDFTPSGTNVSVSGKGVTVSAVTVVNSTTITATFMIGANAATAARSVSVKTPGGTSNTQTFTVQ